MQLAFQDGEGSLCEISDCIFNLKNVLSDETYAKSVIGILFTSSDSKIIIRGNEIKDAGDIYAVMIGGCDANAVEISGNIISNCTKGIHVSLSQIDNFDINNNYIKNCSGGIDCIWTGGDVHISNNCIIDNKHRNVDYRW